MNEKLTETQTVDKKGSKFTFCAYTPIKEVFVKLIAEALVKKWIGRNICHNLKRF